MASETTTTDPRIGEIRKNPKDDRGIHVYEVYTVDGWVCPSDQDTAKVNYDNQDFNQTIASSQADAGLEPVGGTTLDGGSLRYPSDIAVTDKSHYVLFDFKKYNPPYSRTGYSTTTDTNGTTTVDDMTTLRGYNQSAANMTPSGAPQIMLYMPEGVAASYKTNWDGKAFGNAVAGILRSAGDAADGDYLQSIRSTAEWMSKQWERMPATIGAKLVQKAAKTITGDSIQMQDVFSMTGGGILNPNVELIFGGHDLRTLTLGFLMVPYNKKEAQVIDNIVKTFKKSMLPKFNGGQMQNFWDAQDLSGYGIGDHGQTEREKLLSTTGFISNPDLVKVTFMQGSGTNKNVTQFKTMSITDFDVNYSPDGVYAVGPDGYPVATKIQVNLMESKLVYAEDISQGY